jgi:hypothetical protein
MASVARVGFLVNQMPVPLEPWKLQAALQTPPFSQTNNSEGREAADLPGADASAAS